MPAQRAIVVENVAELRGAFRRANKKLGRDLTTVLKDVGEPVRQGAERNVLAGIPSIGFAWSQMRTGISRSVVYVVPKERGRQSRQNPKLRRPNLADLMGPLMDDALTENATEVSQRFDQLLVNVAREWERG